MALFRKEKKIDIKNVNPYTLYAPVKGVLKPIELVDDMVFSSKMMGDGIAIEPIDGKYIVLLMVKSVLYFLQGM